MNKNEKKNSICPQDTDSIWLHIQERPYMESNSLLRFSAILFHLRSLLDLSCFVPNEGSRSLIFEEILRYQWNGSESDLRLEMLKNKGVIGQFSCEYPFTGEFMSIPYRFLALREKCYLLECLHQPTAEDYVSIDAKIAARCGIKKKRMLTYRMSDYIRMSVSDQVVYATNLHSFRSKGFNLYEITVSRAEPVPFTRKRYVLSDGSSFPFGYYAIQ